MNVAQATAAQQAVPYPSNVTDKAERSAMLADRRIALTAIKEAFLDHLEEAISLGRSAEVNAMLRKEAWSRGHHAGYGEVEYHYIDLIDLSDEEILELDD